MSRRTMLRKAAFASSVVASISRRVREIVEWSGGAFVQPDAQKVAQGERVGGALRNSALGVDAFEIPDQEQSEGDPGRQTRPAHRCGVEPGTLRFDNVIEPMLAQQLIQAPIEWVTCGGRQLSRRDLHPRLPLAFAFAHCHARDCSTDDRWQDLSAFHWPL